MFFAYTHTRSKPFLRYALLSCLTLLFLVLFTFLTGGYTSPDSTVYRYTHGYTQKYGSWLSSKLGMMSGNRHPETGNNHSDYDGEENQRTYNIALTERAGHHDEVLGAFLYTLATSPRISNTTVYRNSYRYKFSEIIKPFYPYAPLPVDALFHALNNTFNGDMTGSIQQHDALILSSCDQTLPTMLPSLLPSLSLLPEMHDFKILCIIHDAARPPRDLARIAGPLIERDLITLVVLSHAAERMLKESLFELASGSDEPSDSSDEVNGWDRVSVEVFVPIFPAPLEGSGRSGGRNQMGKHEQYDDLEPGDTMYENVKPKKRILSSVIVQGNIDQHRRDYVSLFRDLEEALERDPSFWGYQALGSSFSGVYEVLPSSSSPPFILHLAGSLLPATSSTQSPPIPSSLVNVVKIHPSLSYPDFFSLMHEVDLVLPAFARAAYYKSSASSTVPASVIAEVPILATRRLLNAYQYLDARTSILRPAGMKEIEAARLLRMGVLPDQYSYASGMGRRTGNRRREISARFDGYDDEELEEEEAYGEYWELELGEESSQQSTSPSVIIDLSIPKPDPDSNSNGDDEENDITSGSNMRLHDADTGSEKEIEGLPLQERPEYLSSNDSDAEPFDEDANSCEDGESSQPSNLNLHANEDLFVKGQISQRGTSHPRARARALLNAHYSRSLPPGAGSLLPRQNIHSAPIPLVQNPPQNTQDRRALEFARLLKRRTISEDEIQEDRNSKREKKLEWDGDMNTLTSRTAMRAMHREIYARNEQVLLRALGG